MLKELDSWRRFESLRWRREINPPINHQFDVTPLNADRDWREPASMFADPRDPQKAR